MEEIQQAIAEYEKYTCLRFKPYTGAESDYMKFYRGSGCSADVGYTGLHWVSLGPGCWMKAIVIHEMGHSLGKRISYHKNITTIKKVPFSPCALFLSRLFSVGHQARGGEYLSYIYSQLVYLSDFGE